jgi:hypothetical protein
MNTLTITVFMECIIHLALGLTLIETWEFHSYQIFSSTSESNLYIWNVQKDF